MKKKRHQVPSIHMRAHLLESNPGVVRGFDRRCFVILQQGVPMLRRHSQELYAPTLTLFAQHIRPWMTALLVTDLDPIHRTGRVCWEHIPVVSSHLKLQMQLFEQDLHAHQALIQALYPVLPPSRPLIGIGAYKQDHHLCLIRSYCKNRRLVLQDTLCQVWLSA